MMTEYIQPILLVSCVATMGAGIQSFAPRLILKLVYDVEISESTTLLLARHGGLLIFLVGALLVYSVYDPSTRDPVLVLASSRKNRLCRSRLLRSRQKDSRRNIRGVW
jgi:hypothetical protein